VIRAPARAAFLARSIELAPEHVQERPQIGGISLKHLSPFLQVARGLRLLFDRLFVRRILSTTWWRGLTHVPSLAAAAQRFRLT
jgi:hypothetical protein